MNDTLNWEEGKGINMTNGSGEEDEKIEQLGEELQESDLVEFFEALYSLKDREIRLSRQNQRLAALILLTKLGYEKENIYQSITYEHYTGAYTADVVVASRPSAEPWITFTIRFYDPEMEYVYPGHRGSTITHVGEELSEFHDATESEHSVLSAP